MLKIDRRQHRLWIAGHRIHGFAAGCFLVGAGLALILHDWPDRQVAFRG